MIYHIRSCKGVLYIHVYDSLLAVHGFEQLSYTTPESDILQSINFRPNVKGTGQPGNIGVISGIINLEEDTAGQCI